MKDKQRKNINVSDTLVWGLIVGFMGGVLLDMVALGLIVGVLLGCIPGFINMVK